MNESNHQARLGIAELDRAHHLLWDALKQAANADDANFPQSFMALVALLEHDFHLEEALMEDYGLPSLHPHREQHAHVLSGLHHTQPKVMSGDLKLGRHALAMLPQWLEIHSATLDQALAAELDIAKASESAA